MLLKEENRWLKRFAVQTLLVLILFSGLSLLINLIPTVLDVLESLLNIFRVSALDTFFSVIGRIQSFLIDALTVIKLIVFAALGFTAVSMKTISIPFIDKFLDKHF